MLGWLLFTALLLTGLTSFGVAGVIAIAVTLTLATLYGSRQLIRPLEAFGFTFACMMLMWPVLGVLTLAILGLVGASAPD